MSSFLFSWCPWNSTISSTAWVILPGEFHVLSMLYTGIGFCKGVSSTLCFSAYVLSIKMTFVPESRSTSSLVKSFWLLAGAIWIDRYISHAGLTLHTNVSSGISSFIIFLLFLLEELSPGLMSLASPLGDPSDCKIELEIFLLSMESSLSLISSTDRTSYLLWLSAHPDWCLEPRLFLTSQPSLCNPWIRPLPHPKTFLEWTWTSHGPCPCLLFPFLCFYPHPRRLHLLLSWRCEPDSTFAPSGAVLLMTATKELALTALQLWLLTFFGEVFFATVEAFVIAAPGGINIHGIRVPRLGPFRCSWFYEIKLPASLRSFLKSATVI